MLKRKGIAFSSSREGRGWVGEQVRKGLHGGLSPAQGPPSPQCCLQPSTRISAPCACTCQHALSQMPLPFCKAELAGEQSDLSLTDLFGSEQHRISPRIPGPLLPWSTRHITGMSGAASALRVPVLYRWDHHPKLSGGTTSLIKVHWMLLSSLESYQEASTQVNRALGGSGL